MTCLVAIWIWDDDNVFDCMMNMCWL